MYTIISVAIVGLVLAILYFYFAYAPSPKEPQLSSTIKREEIISGKSTRTYLSYHAKNTGPSPALLIVLHGTGIDGEKIRAWTGYEFDEMADRYGFFVAYLDGYKGDWNDSRKGEFSETKKKKVNDVKFIRDVISRYENKFHVNPAKIYVFGYSSGGTMAFRMATENPQMLAGIATVSSQLPIPEQSICTLPDNLPKALLVHGSGDSICPVNGGELKLFGRKLGFVMSANATAQQFAQRNGIKGEPIKTRLPHLDVDDPTTVDSYVWSVANKTIVQQYIINGGGHVIPQPSVQFPRILGRKSGDLNVPEKVVEFFGLQHK